jgi:histidinol-phosphate aminotransferase
MDKLQEKVARLIRPEIRALSAYHVSDPGNCIKLDAMENPYHWPDDVISQWEQLLGTAELNRYPDPQARHLSASLREAMAIPASMDILLGNGSDELIQMVALAMAEPGRTILAPDPTFVMYRMIAVFAGMKFAGVPLNRDNFALDMPAMRKAIATHQPVVTFVSYPNNPTGNLFDAGQLEEIISLAPGIVVIDEAYAAFASDSFVNRLEHYDNVLLLRTVSKMGLAGLRLGMLAGPPGWLQEFDKVRLPYNINVLTQLSARFALEQRGMLDAQTESIRSDREVLYAALSAFEEVEVFPSEANFILFRVPVGRADETFEGLKSRGVLIKNLDGSSGLLRDCLRVTVGTQDENQVFLGALEETLS